MLQEDFLAPLTPQDFLQRVLASMSKLALDDTQRQLVIEACLGYFILNYPPPQLVAVVRKVSQKLESVVEMSPVGETNKLLKYIASTQFEYYGVLEEEPKQGSKDQLKTMLSCTQPIGSAPMLALQLNAHRTVLKLIEGFTNIKIVKFVSGTGRDRVSEEAWESTTSYGAFNLTHVEVDVTQKHIPASVKYKITYPKNYDRGLPHIGSDSLTSRDLLRLARWAELTSTEQRWYCLGILGFLLAPAAHSFREVAAIVDKNGLIMFHPQYKYCGFFGPELSEQPWFAELLAAFRGRGFYGDLPFVCDILLKLLQGVDLVKLVLSFLDLPYVALPALKERSGGSSPPNKRQKV